MREIETSESTVSVDHGGVYTFLPSDSFPPMVHSALVIVVYGGEVLQNIIFTHLAHLRRCSKHYASKIPLIAVAPNKIEDITSLQLEQALAHYTRIIVVSIYGPESSYISLHDSTRSQILLNPILFPELSTHPNSELYNYIHSHIAHGAYSTQRPLALPPKFVMSKRHSIIEHVSIMLSTPDQSVPKFIHYLSSLVALQDHQSEHGHRHYVARCPRTYIEDQKRIALFFPFSLWALAGIAIAYNHYQSTRWSQRLYFSTLVLLASAPLGPMLLSRALAIYASINLKIRRPCAAHNRLYLISLGVVILSIQVDAATRLSICLPLVILLNIVHGAIRHLLYQKYRERNYHGKAGEVLPTHSLSYSIKMLRSVKDRISPSFLCKKPCTEFQSNRD
ncbi:Hypothetical protein GLP15_38 [Giardia lamblia P15]|uniref:Uncharacterized protein n=1 Tax=Giardia intestinalis (strain P15) TaxID=658858 RepID=E1F0Q2_GIAIA|nr:Hypothetical protein GLP15_38 [Giardia lamblia P15]